MAYFLDAPNRELKTVAGRTQSNAVVWVGFIVFLASMLLRLFGATAIVGIPIIWIGIFLLAASVLLKFEPITLFGSTLSGTPNPGFRGRSAGVRQAANQD